MFPTVFPAEFTQFPRELLKMAAVPAVKELGESLEIRSRFAFDSDRAFLNSVDISHFIDYVRAFRALEGVQCYIEIGTYDKGNLAYVSKILDDSAIIVDVDLEEHQDQAEKLRRELKPHQTYHQIVGNSASPNIADNVKSLIKKEMKGADAVFIDGNHTAEAVITDYALYSPLVREGGLVMFHDIHWNGYDEYLGVSHAIEILDKITPVFVVSGTRPIYRFMPVLRRASVWGGIGVLVKNS